MTEFRVDETALDRFAGSLDRLQGQVATAECYVQEHVSLTVGDTGALLALVMVTTNAARDAVLDALGRTAELTSAAASEIRESAAMYRQTDDAVNRRMDMDLP